MIIEFDKIIKHVREFSGSVNRDSKRVKMTGEIFTPTKLVLEIIEQLKTQDNSLFDLEKTSIDPSCGDGQFLSEVLIEKLSRVVDENKCVSESNFELALSSIYGVEMESDNVTDCRNRLLCGQEQFRKIVETNIVCHNSLTYDYSFNGTDWTDAEKLGLFSDSTKIKKTKKSAPKKKLILDASGIMAAALNEIN